MGKLAWNETKFISNVTLGFIYNIVANSDTRWLSTDLNFLYVCYCFVVVVI